MSRRRSRPKFRARPEWLEPRALLSTTPSIGTCWSPATAPAGTSETVLVRFLDPIPAGAAGLAIGTLGARVGQSFPDGPTTLSLRPGLSADDAARWLRNTGLVAYAEPDATFQAIQSTPNDPSFASQWALNQSNDVDIDAPQAWDITTGTSATVVAVTDSGIDYTHPDLYLNVALNQGEIPSSIRSALVDTNGDGRLDFYDLNSLNNSGVAVLNASGAPVNAWATHDSNGNGYIDARDLLNDPAWMNQRDNDGDGYVNDIVGWNFVANTNDPFDDNSHGTHVSGTIAATSNNGVGVAGIDWNARILPVKILDSSGNGSNSAAISGINYAAKLGARVINASWGGAPYSSALAGAISAAGTAGSVFIAAAGNYTSNNDTTPFYPASYREPNEVSVAAVNSSGNLSSFSNYGAITVDVGAPGQAILSTIPGGYGYGSGTSMAAPHVSGVAALLAGVHPEYTPTQLVQQILGGTRPLASLAGKTITGGMVDAMLALKASPPSAPSAPTNLAASAGSSSSIGLTWTGSSGATSYKVQRSLDGSTSWTQVGSVGSATTSFTDTGLAAGTTYFYRVVASDAAGDSNPSNTANAATNPAAAPSAPTNLTARASSSNKIALAWGASAGATSYLVERSLDGLNWTQVGTAAGATSYVDGGLSASTTYYYRVRASNSGGLSPYSNTGNATTMKKGK